MGLWGVCFLSSINSNGGRWLVLTSTSGFLVLGVLLVLVFFWFWYWHLLCYLVLSATEKNPEGRLNPLNGASEILSGKGENRERKML